MQDAPDEENDGFGPLWIDLQPVHESPARKAPPSEDFILTEPGNLIPTRRADDSGGTTEGLKEILNKPVAVSCQCDIWTDNPQLPRGRATILKKSLNQCSARGEEELIIIGKNFSRGARVCFKEIRKGKIIWSRAVDVDRNFSELTHLVCTVPPYFNTEIKIQVEVQIVVQSIHKMSNPVSFTYLPCFNSKDKFSGISHPKYPRLVSESTKSATSSPIIVSPVVPPPIAIIPLDLLVQQEAVLDDTISKALPANFNQQHLFQNRLPTKNIPETLPQQYWNTHSTGISTNSGSHRKEIFPSMTKFTDSMPPPYIDMQHVQSLRPSTRAPMGIFKQQDTYRGHPSRWTFDQNYHKWNPLVLGSNENCLNDKYWNPGYRSVYPGDSRVMTRTLPFCLPHYSGINPVEWPARHETFNDNVMYDHVSTRQGFL